MTFKEEDIPLMKLIFNPETHAMGMMMGKKRAERIFNYVYYHTIGRHGLPFFEYISYCYYKILINVQFKHFFWDNRILKLSLIERGDICLLLAYSSIAQEIWDSGGLNFTTLTRLDIYKILRDSPIAKNIWDSGKLDLSLFTESEIEEYNDKFKD